VVVAAVEQLPLILFFYLRRLMLNPPFLLATIGTSSLDPW
jgi:hypothetical protein